MNSPIASTEVKIWDRLVRVGHWVLAGGFAVAYLTEDDLLTVHVWSGYLVGAIVCLRILWGFIGSKHARFRDFLYSPRQAMLYLLDAVRGRAKRYLGHSPAGAVMVYALLVAISATTFSGLMVYAYDEDAGPLASVVANQYVGMTEQERRRASEPEEDFWEETHEVLANLTLFLVVLHIGGVAFSSMVHRENLVRAMVTGRKRAER
ncbi:MAG TPA: cytochrome b/b6 domain-containing protein [Pseudomonadales bacterium]